MFEQEQKKAAEEAASKAEAQAQAQVLSSNSSSNVTANSNASNNSSSNEVVNDTSNSVDTGSSDVSEGSATSPYIKAIHLIDGRDLTDSWQLTWDELERITNNPQIYFMRYSDATPTAKGRFYIFNKDNTIARLSMESRFFQRMKALKMQ